MKLRKKKLRPYTLTEFENKFSFGLLKIEENEMEYNDYFEAECKRTNTVFDDWSNCYFYSEIYYYYDEEVCDRALEAVQKWYKDRDMDVLEKVTHPMNSEYPFAIAVELRESELRIVKDPDF